MGVLVTGAGSAVAREFISLVESRYPAETIATLGRGTDTTFTVDLGRPEAVDELAGRLARFDRLMLCHGLLRDQTLLGQSGAEMLQSMSVNLLSTVRLIEHALRAAPRMRIAVIGSESGFKGSYDDTYALAKAALHSYVGWRRTETADQQLVCIAPSMIADAGMTTRRTDQDRVAQRGAEHPKGRLLQSEEIARLAFHVLYEGSNYLTNTVIPVDGGKFTAGAGMPRP